MAVSLPVVSYAEVDPGALLPASVEDKAAVPFGFNDGSQWKGLSSSLADEAQDGSYIRWIRESAV